MAITYEEFDQRTETLITLLETATLGDGLPEEPAVNKGPWAAGTPGPDPFAIYVHRMGMPSFDYGQAADPVTVTQSLAVGCVCSYPGDREDMEAYVAYLAANVTRVLLANVQVSGTYGWDTGLVVDSDAVRYRTRDNTTFEVELFQFDVTFEVDR